MKLFIMNIILSLPISVGLSIIETDILRRQLPDAIEALSTCIGLDQVFRLEFFVFENFDCLKDEGAANGIKCDQKYDADIAEHECRKVTAMILETLKCRLLCDFATKGAAPR